MILKFDLIIIQKKIIISKFKEIPRSGSLNVVNCVSE